MIVHEQIHSEHKPHVCSTCGKSFAELEKLLVHVAGHSDAPKYLCTTCDKGFKKQSSLASHQLTHSDDRPHQCQTCNKPFKTAAALGHHQLTHSNERPHKCDKCSKTFKTSSTLGHHALTHKLRQPSDQLGLALGLSDGHVGVRTAVAVPGSLPYTPSAVIMHRHLPLGEGDSSTMLPSVDCPETLEQAPPSVQPAPQNPSLSGVGLGMPTPTAMSALGPPPPGSPAGGCDPFSVVTRPPHAPVVQPCAHAPPGLPPSLSGQTAPPQHGVAELRALGQRQRHPGEMHQYQAVLQVQTVL